MDTAGGHQVKADVQRLTVVNDKYEAKFKPDDIQIGRWMAQRFLQAALRRLLSLARLSPAGAYD